MTGEPFSNVALNRRWQSIHDSEREAWHRLGQADLDDMASKPKKQLKRAWWREVSIALRFYQNARTRHNVNLLPFPGELLALLANITEEMAEGVSIDLVRVAVGGNRMTRQQRLDVQAAISYIDAAETTSEPKSKRIDEVVEKYGVDERTVKGWIGKFRSKFVTPYDEAMLLTEDCSQDPHVAMLEAAERFKALRKTRKSEE